MGLHRYLKASFLALAWSLLFRQAKACRICQPRDIVAELSTKLSPEAVIHQSTDVDFQLATQRWSAFAAPRYQAYIEPATEQDVQEIINYANRHSLPFLGVNGGHGWSSRANDINCGLGISLKQMTKFEMREDGQSARLGGGWKAGELGKYVNTLGKRTVTGGADCTGVMGVALGGGHSLLQGHHGTLADQIVEARIVLANGSAVTASERTNSDLLWAIKGAGHAFGIVTEATYKIYNSPKVDTWTILSFIYPGSKLESVLTAVNAMTKNGTDAFQKPAGLTDFGIVTLVPGIDANEPVLIFYLIYDGSESELKPFAEPFLKLRPLVNTSQSVPFTDVGSILGFGEDSTACADGYRFQGFPVSIDKYDTKAMRGAYITFSSLINQYPEFNASWLALEGYAWQGVRAIPDKSTSVGDRNKNYIISVSLRSWTPAFDDVAKRFGEKIRRIIHAATGQNQLFLYVNYHHGEESLSEMYGHDRYRVQRLKELKKKYDPNQKFSYYTFITTQ